MKFNVWLLSFVVGSSCALQDYFSSIHSLKDIFKTEEELLENLKVFSFELQKQLDLIKK